MTYFCKIICYRKDERLKMIFATCHLFPIPFFSSVLIEVNKKYHLVR